MQIKNDQLAVFLYFLAWIFFWRVGPYAICDCNYRKFKGIFSIDGGFC
jgi:hypothetical protein